MRIKSAIALVLSLTMLFFCGCRAGLSEDELRLGVQSLLNDRFQANLFEMAQFKRRGSYPRKTSESHKEYLVYFDCKLRFVKDYSMGDWDNLSQNSLASLLGANVSGIRGVLPSGNKKGDEILVFGSVVQKQGQDGIWTIDSHSPQAAKVSRIKSLEEGNLSENPVQRIKSLRLKPQFKENSLLDTLTEEFRFSEIRTHLKIDQMEGKESLLSGRLGGEYYQIGQEIQTNYQKSKETLKLYATSGSIENLILLSESLSTFAIVQSDITSLAINGVLPGFDLKLGKEAHQDIVAVGSLYPEAIQILVTKASKITDITELKGKRISMGPRHGGARLNAEQVLQGLQFTPLDYQIHSYSGLEESIEAMVQNEVDAVFTTMAWPASPIREAMNRHSLRLISLNEFMRNQITNRVPHLIPVKIARHTYPNMDMDVSSLGVTALVLTRRNTEKQKVKDFLQYLYQSETKFSVSIKNARTGVTIPMHPAAEEFLNLMGSVPH